jgi:hypothetical protein
MVSPFPKEISKHIYLFISFRGRSQYYLNGELTDVEKYHHWDQQGFVDLSQLHHQLGQDGDSLFTDETQKEPTLPDRLILRSCGTL